ncbi:MAG TPA: HdeD family acid-resistance protein [Candidatus Dormibacteraeota bacterium]|nr:HdeD family acid-resistance protein [Candidatus Dormibacteraeota bacterium]
MDQALTRGSRLLALGGIAAVLFGVVALVWPGITLVALVALFGSFALVFGVLTVVYGIDMARHHVGHSVPMVFSGLFGIGIGVVTFFRPGITALALLYLIAVWAILTGTLEIAAGIEFTGEVKGAWALWLGGLASVAFGVLVALRPVSGALAIVWLIGVYAIALGVTRLVYAYRIQQGKETIKSAIKTVQQPTPAATR